MNNLLIQRAVIVDMLYLEIPTSDDGITTNDDGISTSEDV